VSTNNSTLPHLLHTRAFVRDPNKRCLDERTFKGALKKKKNDPAPAFVSAHTLSFLSAPQLWQGGMLISVITPGSSFYLSNEQ
jgi:hypothetical protein